MRQIPFVRRNFGVHVRIEMRRINSGFRSGPPFGISALAALISGAGRGESRGAVWAGDLA